MCYFVNRFLEIEDPLYQLIPALLQVLLELVLLVRSQFLYIEVIADKFTHCSPLARVT